MVPQTGDFSNAYYTALQRATPGDIKEATLVAFKEVQEKKEARRMAVFPTEEE